MYYHRLGILSNGQRYVLSNKGKYGLKALVHLAKMVPGELALAAQIAAANNIPKKFLDGILNDLKNAGLVHTKKGPGGGYTLARPARDITVGQATRVLDGALAPIACASRNFYRPCDDCLDVAVCSVRLVMLEARDAMAAVLDGTSIGDLAAQETKAARQSEKAARKRSAVAEA